MAALFDKRAEHRGPSAIHHAVPAYSVLLLPTGLLLAAGLRSVDTNNWMLWLATAFQGVLCLLSFVSRRNWQQPLGSSVITFYLLALAWLWWGDSVNDWYTNFAKAILLVVPLVVFGWQTLAGFGARRRFRRARVLADRLANRKEWPPDLASCRTLPEVKALRVALNIDASPALALLNHKRPEVRVAATGRPWNFARTGGRARPSWCSRWRSAPSSRPYARRRHGGWGTSTTARSLKPSPSSSTIRTGTCARRPPSRCCGTPSSAGRGFALPFAVSSPISSTRMTGRSGMKGSC